MLPDEERAKRWNRQLPQSPDAERGLLCCFINRPSLIDDYGDMPVETFCNPVHRTIFETLRGINAQNIGVDLITLTQRLEDKGLLDQVGGAAGVTDISIFTPSASLHRDYAGILREKWVRRRMLSMAEVVETAARSEDDSGDIEQLVAICEESALKLRAETESKTQDSVQHCEKATIAALDHIEMIYQKRGKVIGLATGFVDVDRMTGGLQGPRLYVIGGLPGSGKTAAALQIAEHVALDQDSPVLTFTQEMGSMELMVRALCRRSGIDLQRVRDGFLGKTDLKNLLASTEQLSKSRLFLDETPGLTTAQFRARCRTHAIKNKIKLIVVDYLQLMRGVSKSAKDNRQQEIAEISGTLKAVAKELHLPVIVLAQLKRDAEDRKGPPKLADLRESGAIGQDADFVGLLHALDDKKKTAKSGKNSADLDDDEDDAPEPEFNTIFNVVKQRQGPVGEIKLRFVKKYTRFEDVTKALYSNNEEARQH